MSAESFLSFPGPQPRATRWPIPIRNHKFPHAHLKRGNHDEHEQAVTLNTQTLMGRMIGWCMVQSSTRFQTCRIAHMVAPHPFHEPRTIACTKHQLIT